MRIGISAFAWTSQFERFHLEILRTIKAMGMSGAEIPMFDPSSLPVKGIRDTIDKSGLECAVCAILPEGINPISQDFEVRRAAVEHLSHCVETAAAMGAKLLGGPLFAPIGYLPEHRPTQDEWSWAVETFQSLSDVLNVNDMILSIEPINRSETFFLRRAAEAQRLCELIGNLRIGVTIDTFHANIEERSIPAAIQSLGNHLKHIHASENDRGPLAFGHVPFVEIISVLKAIEYYGYLMIEGFGYSEKERNAPRKSWASLNVSPETLGLESAQYLKEMLAGATQ